MRLWQGEEIRLRQTVSSRRARAERLNFIWFPQDSLRHWRRGREAGEGSPLFFDLDLGDCDLSAIEVRCNIMPDRHGQNAQDDGCDHVETSP